VSTSLSTRLSRPTGVHLASLGLEHTWRRKRAKEDGKKKMGEKYVVGRGTEGSIGGII
jgi:hypothetical protein